MSGGVDSTACALILRDTHDVRGFFMQLDQPDLSRQKNRVQKIAERIGIDLEIIDLHKEFKTRVLDYFSDSYFQGLTPNPCIICNREIKFGLFFEIMQARGVNMMATGHYARIKKGNGRYHLYRGEDVKKDQSYFLSRLTQQQLGRILFPLGNMTKNSIYDLVESHGFDDFRGRESQDVCFLENNQVGSYLESRAASHLNTGPIKSTAGETLGTHKGLYRYTIGQRRGLGISNPSPLYVIRIDLASNSVIVGSSEELFQKTITVNNIHWLAGIPPNLEKDYNVKIRYTHGGAAAKLTLLDKDRGELNFYEPQRAVTPGQFAVVYDDKELLGSAIIV